MPPTPTPTDCLLAQTYTQPSSPLACEDPPFISTRPIIRQAANGGQECPPVVPTLIYGACNCLLGDWPTPTVACGESVIVIRPTALAESHGGNPCPVETRIVMTPCPPTFTPTSSPTPTATRTNTPTPIVSPTPTITPSPTRTSTPTLTATPTQRPTATPTRVPAFPAALDCRRWVGAPDSKFLLGGKGWTEPSSGQLEQTHAAECITLCSNLGAKGVIYVPNYLRANSGCSCWSTHVISGYTTTTDILRQYSCRGDR